MTYIILARKYRPQNFDEVIGQDHIATTLKNAVASNHLAQAYLFAGPRGVGKTSMARILAKSLNCINGPTLKPCQKCSSCIEISQGRSLDCIEIDGASNRGIDEIRTLRENVKFAPSSGSFKIYIIDEVHMLTTEAFNALLKTLEEPPEHVKFIFATTQPQKVISTILSRCQRFNFSNIPMLKIIDKLKMIAKTENITISDEALFMIAKEAGGSIRDAESIFDQVITLSKDKIEPTDINTLLGTLEYDFLFDVVDKIIKKDVAATLKLISSFLNQGKEPAILFSTFLEHIRNLTLSKFFKTNQESYLDLPLDIKERLISQAKSINLKELLHMFDIILKYQEQAKYFSFPQIILEMMAIKLTLQSEDSKTKEKDINISNETKKDCPLNKNPSNIESRNSKTYTQNTKILEDAPYISNDDFKDKDCNIKNQKIDTKIDTKIAKQIPTVKLETVKEKWTKILDDISGIKMSVSTYLKEAYLLSIDNDILRLGFPENLIFHKEALEHKENYSLLEKVLHNYLNTDLKIKFETIKNDNIGVDIDTRNKNIDTSIVRSALDTFKGRLID